VAAAEKTTDFAKRLSSEFGNFARGKGRQLTDKLQEGANRVVSGVDERAYQAALSVVARRHNLATEEAELKLKAPPRKNKK